MRPECGKDDAGQRRAARRVMVPADGFVRVAALGQLLETW